MHNVSARIRSVVACLSHRGKARAVLLVAGAALGFAGCAQQPPQLAASTAHHSKEYFSSATYGTASRRVVESGPVPHGGGQYLVGRPYSVAGHTYYPSERRLVQVGNASWYGDAFHGRLTANGEIYDRDSFTAAHPTMPLPSYARVTNLRTQASMIVRVNDRGPFAANRVMDVSRGVAEALDFRQSGTARVKVEYVGRASLAGSDDKKLYATLRKNGPAEWHEGDPAMVAEAAPAARVASLQPVAAADHPPPHRREIMSPRPVVTNDDDETPHAPPRLETHAIDRILSASGDARIPQHRHRATAGQSDAQPIERASRLLSEPMPLSRPQRYVATLMRAPLPPSRPMDLGTIPGAGVPIRGPHPTIHIARSRDD